MASEKQKYDLLVDGPKFKSSFNFKKDLALGKWGEDYVKRILSDPKVKIEVKKDDWTIKSGNIAIEFESRGKPSGIAVTESHFWCFIVGHFYVLMMPTEFLKWIVEQNHGTIKSVGDRDANGVPTSKAVLLPWDELLSLFKDYNKKKSEL